MPGADDPFPRQRQHDPVLAVLTIYGRRCGHQALRPSPNGAHIPPLRDCRANHQSVTHPGRIRATTNQVRIGDPVTRTRIRKQSEFEFFGLTGPSGFREPVLSASPPGTKRRQINRLPNRQAQAAALFRRPSGVKSGCQSVASSQARCPDPGRGRRKRAQKEPESATRRVMRFAGRKAIPIRLAVAPEPSHGAQCVNSA